MIGFPGILLDSEPATTGFSPSLLAITALLDFAGLAIAIWTVWSSISLPQGGQLLRAFRFIAVGSLAFALSHLLDTILQLLDVDASTVIHQGAVLIAVLFFLPGLAQMTGTLPGSNSAQADHLPRFTFWPLVAAFIITVCALSFIFYGFGVLAEVATFFALDGSLLILSVYCVFLAARARLGGAIGRALWLAIFGLLLFSLAHPVQVWFYEQTDYTPALLGIVHRIIVMPAFFLFAISITYAAHTLNRATAA